MRPYKTDDPRLAFLSPLIEILCRVESGGISCKIGDNGKAHGILQIHDICVKDVNRIYGSQYTWDKNAFDPAISKRICWLYLSYYFLKWKGSNPESKMSDEEAASRIWNGGPNGWKKRATDVYWKKVREMKGARG